MCATEPSTTAAERGTPVRAPPSPCEAVLACPKHSVFFADVGGGCFLGLGLWVSLPISKPEPVLQDSS